MFFILRSLSVECLLGSLSSLGCVAEGFAASCSNNTALTALPCELSSLYLDLYVILSSLSSSSHLFRRLSALPSLRLADAALNSFTPLTSLLEFSSFCYLTLQDTDGLSSHITESAFVFPTHSADYAVCFIILFLGSCTVSSLTAASQLCLLSFCRV